MINNIINLIKLNISRKIAILISLFLILSSLFILIIYIFNHYKILILDSNFIPISDEAAVIFLLFGIFFTFEIFEKKFKYITFIILTLISLISLLILADYQFNNFFNLNDFLMVENDFINGKPIGKISEITTFIFLVISIVLFFIKFLSNWRYPLYLNLGILVFSYLLINAYLYKVPFFYSSEKIIPISFLSSILINLISINIFILYGKEYFPLKFFIGKNATARIMRGFIITIFFINLLNKFVIINFSNIESNINAIRDSLLDLFTLFFGGHIALYISKRIGNTIDSINVEKDQALYELRKNKISLEQANKKFETIFEKANFAISLSKLNDGTLIKVNEAWEKTFGFDRDFVTGKTTQEIGINKESIKRENNFKMIEQLKSIKNFKIECNTSDGRILFGLVNIEVVEIDDELFYISTFFDETDRKIAEEKLFQSEERFRRISNIASDVSFSCVNSNGKSKIDWINGATEDIFGYSNSEIIDYECWGKFVVNEDINIFNENILNLKPTEKSVCELRIRKNDNSIVFINANTECFLLENGLNTRLYGSLINITPLKIIQHQLIEAKIKAEENDKLKTAFLQNMSHEIRTPLNGIVGFSNLLQSDDISHNDISDYTKAILQSSNRLLEIVNNILEISKIETGQINITHSNVNIRTLFNRLKLFFEPLVSNKKNILEISSFDDISLMTDDTKLYQILINLINNANKFTNNGKISLKLIELEKFIEFQISDSGIGIPKEKFDLIFERFTQVDLGITRGYEGAGLGLAICKGLVEILGGKIWFESEFGKGSTFYFTLPKLPLVEEIQIKNVQFKKNSILPTKKTILVVEDDEISSDYIIGLLRKANFNILKCSNGISAVETVKNSTHINIILMDIKLPLMDGITAAKLIKEYNKDIIIIAQTASAFNEDKEYILNNDFNDFISKPISPETLLNTINQYL